MRSFHPVPGWKDDQMVLMNEAYEESWLGGVGSVWTGWIVWTGSTSTRDSSKFTVGGINLGTLGREALSALTGLCFLGPQWLGRLSRSTALDMGLAFLFLAWIEVFWMTGGAVASLSSLVMFFSLFSLIVVISMTRKIKLKKKKRMMREKKNGWYSLRRVVSSWPRFSAVGIGPSPHIAKQLRVTRSWKILPGKARTWSIRSK